MDSDYILHEVESLRTRLSKLSEANGLVSESLDLDVVLQRVINFARCLTGARYGALLTYERSGAMQDFVTSGLSPTEKEHLDTLPKIQGLRVDDNVVVAQGVIFEEAVSTAERHYRRVLVDL